VSLVYDIRGGQLRALDDVSFSVRDGEFVCIIGPSGCGKSTLLHIIAGLLGPTAGEILLNGHPVSGPGADRAMVFQDDAVFPWLTVQANIEYGLRLKGMGKADRTKLAREYLDLVGLGGMGHLYPRELSGGMRKRVDLARMFANDPEVLLMDEPFGMLDAMTKSNLHGAMMDIWGRARKTVCFVTHDLEEALFLGDRVLVMQARPGRIQQEILVPFERPRTAKLKTSTELQDLRRQLFDTLVELSRGM